MREQNQKICGQKSIQDQNFLLNLVKSADGKFDRNFCVSFCTCAPSNLESDFSEHHLIGPQEKSPLHKLVSRATDFDNYIALRVCPIWQITCEIAAARAILKDDLFEDRLPACVCLQLLLEDARVCARFSVKTFR
jgi:hypothetical protein